MNEFNQHNERAEKTGLYSENGEAVKTRFQTTIELTIHEVIPIIAQNFSPEDCADIILDVLKKLAEDVQHRKDIVFYARELRSTEKTPLDTSQ